jgi:hypothetical protein
LNALTSSSSNKARGIRYQAARVLPLRKLFRTIKPLFPSKAVLVDFGSGKGRILMLAAESGFTDVRGVEFAKELCEIARKNCDQYKIAARSNAKFTITESDATEYKIAPEENVFILYNPFDDAIISAVLDNISLSIDKQPRQVFIIYYHPKWGQTIEQRPNFKSLYNFDFWGYKLAVYSNTN